MKKDRKAIPASNDTDAPVAKGGKNGGRRGPARAAGETGEEGDDEWPEREREEERERAKYYCANNLARRPQTFLPTLEFNDTSLGDDPFTTET